MKNLYLDKKEKKDCNGCGVCVSVCPKQCIKMKEDEEGFLYPVIDEKKCIKCNKCKNICSNNLIVREKGEAYIAINKIDEQRKKSASGGMFFLLASNIQNKKGIVFGAKYNENLEVIHDYAKTLKECEEFMGSKYVRSNTDGIYDKVKEFLKEDKYVLFTGTPCQIAGLKLFLNKEYEKLITCEIICHANPSPKIFKKYIKELEVKRNKTVNIIEFRSKENGWSNSTPIINYSDGTKEEDRTFYNAFIAELFNRPSCHSCVFSGIERQADFTIGDLWGIEKIDANMNDKKGVSLLILNSLKAKNIFNEIKENLDYKKIDLELAFSYNHNKNVPMNEKRTKFFKKVNKYGNVIKYMQKYSKIRIYKRILGKVKRILIHR